MCGHHMDADNSMLVEWLTQAGVMEHTELLGSRQDMPYVYAALDILVSTSAYGEAFPLVIGEAIASGTLCVATDLGDSRQIIGDTGYIVATRDPGAVAKACIELIDRGLHSEASAAAGAQARQRIVDSYGLDAVASRYSALYQDVLSAR